MSTGRLIVGLGLVVLGVVAALDSAGAIDGGSATREWWPVALVALGASQVVSDRRVGWSSGGLIVIGLVLLAGTTGLFGEGGLGVVWPILLILFGVAVIVGWGMQRAVISDAEFSRIVVASAPRLDVRSEGFRRADLMVVVGTARVDLLKASLDDAGARISITVVAGSAEVIVPEGWRVVVRGVAVLGGWDDTTSRRVPDDAPELEVRALAVLGGVDVRHRKRWA